MDERDKYDSRGYKHYQYMMFWDKLEFYRWESRAYMDYDNMSLWTRANYWRRLPVVLFKCLIWYPYRDVEFSNRKGE